MKFLLKQKGKNKIKNYPKTRSEIIEYVKKIFGSQVDDLPVEKRNSTFFLRNTNLSNEIKEKLMKKLKTGTYVVDIIETTEQKFYLFVNLESPISIRTTSKGYKKHIYPGNNILIYVFTENKV
ncbi:hypothetical protein K9M48_04720 [Candidatus Gracilibacteria bacterium]|nr:hypothetical protein [Candidatus Gracilibacteria bacterium]